MTKTCINISDLKRITQNFYIETGVDFRQYADSSLKYRVERIMKSYNLLTADELLQLMRGNKQFHDNFIFEIQVPETEFFRDAEMWIAFQKQILPKLAKKSKVQIFVPGATTGDELYSLMFFLHKAQILEQCEITVSVLHKKNELSIQQAVYSTKKLDQTKKNLEMINPDLKPDDIFSIKPDTFVPKIRIGENVKFIYGDLSSLDFQNKFDLIVFRNKLLYFNEKSHKESIRSLYDALQKNGYLILGIGEDPGELYKRRLKESVKGERIYKKTGL